MTTIRFRRGTTTQWETANPVLASGEPGYDLTLDVFKVGDGTSTWMQLPIQSTGTPGGDPGTGEVLGPLLLQPEPEGTIVLGLASADADREDPRGWRFTVEDGPGADGSGALLSLIGFSPDDQEYVTVMGFSLPYLDGINGYVGGSIDLSSFPINIGSGTANSKVINGAAGAPSDAGLFTDGTILTAAASSVYANSGARLLRKEGGLGTGFLRVLAGDTGFRRIGTLYGLPAAAVLISRNADMVTVSINPDHLTALDLAGQLTGSDLPTGFRPAGAAGSPYKSGEQSADLVGSDSNRIAGEYVTIYVTGTFIVRGVGAGTEGSCMFTFKTSDPWPTTLPGTAAP